MEPIREQIIKAVDHARRRFEGYKIPTDPGSPSSVVSIPVCAFHPSGAHFELLPNEDGQGIRVIGSLGPFGPKWSRTESIPFVPGSSEKLEELIETMSVLLSCDYDWLSRGRSPHFPHPKL